MSAYDRLDGAARTRVESAWRDGEVTIDSIRARFRLTAEDVDVVRALLGPKAKLSLMSDRARTVARRALKTFAAARRELTTLEAKP